MKSAKEYLSNVALIALLVANIVPVAGVLFLARDAFYIVLFYWAENVAVGFYTILKIACVKAPHPVAHLGKLFAIPFFMVH
jgi:tryptophan synthase beta subunit